MNLLRQENGTVFFVRKDTPALIRSPATSLRREKNGPTRRKKPVLAKQVLGHQPFSLGRGGEKEGSRRTVFPPKRGEGAKARRAAPTRCKSKIEKGKASSTSGGRKKETGRPASFIEYSLAVPRGRKKKKVALFVRHQDERKHGR